MKKKYILVLICSSILPVMFNQVQAQVGINTEYPRTVFHIDGAGDNPQDLTSSLSDLQQSNDIVISNDGKLGVGTITPGTKLDITDNKSITGQEALKLTPALGVPSILYLEGDGQTTTWRPAPNIGILGQFRVTSTSFPSRVATYAGLVSMDGTMTVEGGYKIRVPANGRYFVTLNIYGTNNSTSSSPGSSIQSLYIYLAKNDTQVQSMEYDSYYSGIGSNLADVIEYYQATPLSTGSRINSFTVSLYAGYCVTSDYLVVRFAPVVGYSTTSSFTPNTLNPITITIYNI